MDLRFDNCIVRSILHQAVLGQVILEEVFSFAQVGSLPAHHFQNPKRQNHTSTISRCCCHRHCLQCSSSQGSTVIQHCWLILVEKSYCNNNYQYTPTVTAFTLASTFHVPFPLPHTMHGCFWNDFDVETKNLHGIFFE